MCLVTNSIALQLIWVQVTVVVSEISLYIAFGRNVVRALKKSAHIAGRVNGGVQGMAEVRPLDTLYKLKFRSSRLYVTQCTAYI
jgi:hypothetical protein